MSLPKLKRIIVALVALVALALPATALASYLVPGKAGVVLRKGPRCTAQFYTSGPYTGQGLERCPAGSFERIQWSASGYWGHDTLDYFGQTSCVHAIKLSYDGRSHAIWRFGSYYHGCSVRVRAVTFTR